MSPIGMRTEEVMAFSTFEARARRHRLLLPLLAGAALAVVVIIALAMVLGGSDESVTPARPLAGDPPADTVQPRAALAPAAPAKPVEMTSVTIRVTTSPDDATVLLDGERLGRTPLAIERPRTPGPVWLKVRKKGHKTRKIEVDLGADVSWDITLPTSK
jgi:hypothetical protein